MQKLRDGLPPNRAGLRATLVVLCHAEDPVTPRRYIVETERPTDPSLASGARR